MMVYKVYLFIKKHLLELQEDKSIQYVIGWKSKGVYTYKLTPLYTVFVHNIKLSGCKIEIRFNMIVFVVEQNNNATKIVNA